MMTLFNKLFCTKLSLYANKLSSSKNKFLKEISYSVLIFLSFSIVFTLFFSPALLSGKLLAPGDGIIQSVPALYSIRTVWTSLLLSGFPISSDPTVQAWYPISIIFSLIPNSWNAYVISAYVMASSFSYFYIYTITNSILASTVAGIIYGMSGFMMAHLGHTSMIHTAAWIPLIICSLNQLSTAFNGKWFAIGCFAVACCVLAGHPQITVYALALSTFYFIFLSISNFKIIKYKYLIVSISLLFLGITLSFVQIIQTAQLSSLGLRKNFSFEDFNSYSLPPLESIQLIFPYFFGGVGNIPYFGTWGLTETTGYVGIITILFSLVSLTSLKTNKVDQKLILFWLFIALFTFFLALGDSTPLSWLIYHIPLLNKFRVPSRHFIEMTLAFSTLAGIGVSHIEKKLIHKTVVDKLSLCILYLLIFLILSIYCIRYLLLNFFQTSENSNLLKVLQPFHNSGLYVPLLIILTSIVLLSLWIKNPSYKLIKFLIPIYIVLDLASFGWFYEWQYNSPDVSILTPKPHVQKYSEILTETSQRFLPVNGGLGTWDEIPPNISRLWNVPSVSYYGPLILSRVSQLLSMSTPGNTSKTILSDLDQSLNIMAVKFISTNFNKKIKGIDWPNEDINILIGSDCGSTELQSYKFSLPSNAAIETVTSIGVVSSLACAANIPNKEEVAEIILTDKSGQSERVKLLAGYDSSEWAYNCSDVTDLMKHDQAKIFSSYPVVRENYPTCTGHSYYSLLPVNKFENIENIELNWLSSSGAINIQKFILIDDKLKESYPISQDNIYVNNFKRWLYVEDVGDASFYENLDVMPRSWLVPEVKTLEPDQILSAIKSSKLPDGSTYDPSQVALVEDEIQQIERSSDFDLSSTTKFIQLDDTHVQVKTISNSPSFLILSDLNYPGWKAKVNGKKTHIFPTNYVLRGVLLPAGENIVELEFRSLTFDISLAVSIASLFLIFYISFTPLRTLRR